MIKNVLTRLIIPTTILTYALKKAFPIYKIQGISMYPTLKENDRVYGINAYFNELKRFDIVVINIENKSIIKRIIALPNEFIFFPIFEVFKSFILK